ncbi:MAG TPA: isoprenylcysteine carboxylmethyltransferase family protein [Acidobacteriaceae bacterium]|nr:isoprenylcysteine carboxylmethyltransferase family protein [Acidobacteriaceae bacterium]
MSVVIRTLAYATVFIGFLIIYLPSRILGWTGTTMPLEYHGPQITGMVVGLLGVALTFSCVISFIRMGRGTPAPFDAPRQLVIRGPYRFVRNPMYIGAALILAGVAIFYESPAIVIYAVAFLLLFHLFVVFYEEPTLRRKFGPDYIAYCHRVGRWWPALHTMTRYSNSSSHS